MDHQTVLKSVFKNNSVELIAEWATLTIKVNEENVINNKCLKQASKSM